jgi:hypothetical protein
MHYLHLIAVAADAEDEAIATAENAIAAYGDGDV